MMISVLMDSKAIFQSEVMSLSCSIQYMLLLLLAVTVQKYQLIWTRKATINSELSSSYFVPEGDDTFYGDEGSYFNISTSIHRPELSSLILGGDDPGDGNGAEEEEADEGKLLHPPA